MSSGLQCRSTRAGRDPTRLALPPSRSECAKRAMATLATVRSRRKQIWHRAFHDELTGLPNRYLFSDRLDEALTASHRHPHGFAVIYVDVDRFKTVNDAFGHAAGDELLKHIGASLANGLRSGDTAARLGGDEFALLLQDVADVMVVRAAVRRIHDAPALIRHADISMYAQKRNLIHAIAQPSRECA
jgi:PleD family two-component response regulator